MKTEYLLLFSASAVSEHVFFNGIHKILSIFAFCVRFIVAYNTVPFSLLFLRNRSFTFIIVLPESLLVLY
jgi:hypothetical protein